MALTLTSNSFVDGGMFPPKYTCDGANISPPLGWSGAPSGAKTFALINDDPDAPGGDWVHWVVWNIPATVQSLKEGMPKEAKFGDGTRQGTTDFGDIGYGGACPPSGVHRYFFKLYALDTILELPPTTKKAQLLSSIKGHVLEETKIMAKYSRR